MRLGGKDMDSKNRQRRQTKQKPNFHRRNKDGKNCFRNLYFAGGVTALFAASHCGQKVAGEVKRLEWH